MGGGGVCTTLDVPRSVLNIHFNNNLSMDKDLDKLLLWIWLLQIFGTQVCQQQHEDDIKELAMCVEFHSQCHITTDATT